MTCKNALKFASLVIGGIVAFSLVCFVTTILFSTFRYWAELYLRWLRN